MLCAHGIESEFVFVDDGSRDRTYAIINELACEAEKVVGLHFSRNFGKEAAISAGLAAANGNRSWLCYAYYISCVRHMGTYRQDSRQSTRGHDHRYHHNHFHRQHHHDKPWHHWLLYCSHI